MSKYRANLPQLGSQAFLSDSGLETTLVFLEGIDLPFFAAFPAPPLPPPPLGSLTPAGVPAPLSPLSPPPPSLAFPPALPPPSTSPSSSPSPSAEDR